MPRGDGTGPMGYGPMTGRGLGYCSGSEVPGYATGWGPGFGRGFRCGLVVVLAAAWEEVSDGASEEVLQDARRQESPRRSCCSGKKMLEERLELINKDLESL